MLSGCKRRQAQAGQFILDLGDDALSAGDNATLSFEYTASLEGAGTGIYRSPVYTYTDAEGQEQEGLIIASQHEDVYARQSVPSFDEPYLKARWVGKCCASLAEHVKCSITSDASSLSSGVLGATGCASC